MFVEAVFLYNEGSIPAGSEKECIGLGIRVPGTLDKRLRGNHVPLLGTLPYMRRESSNFPLQKSVLTFYFFPPRKTRIFTEEKFPCIPCPPWLKFPKSVDERDSSFFDSLDSIAEAA